MKKIITFLAVATLSLLIASCKKDHADSQTAQYELKFSTEALAYVQLPLYKYFIYKDSATASLDSVIVTQSNLERIFVPASSCSGFCISYPSYFYQRFTLALSKITNTGNQSWFNESASLESFNTLFLRSSDSSALNFPWAFAYPISSSYLLASFIVEGKTYNNVLQFSLTNFNPGDPMYHKTNYYWAKGIGIIKREIQIGSSIKTYLLVRNG